MKQMVAQSIELLQGVIKVVVAVPWLLDPPKRVRETGTYQKMAARETAFGNRKFSITLSIYLYSFR